MKKKIKIVLLLMGSFLLFSHGIFGQEYKTTWLGNTFGYGDGKWVQNNILSLYVADDGKCYTQTIWDEGHNERSIYKDGDKIGSIGGGLETNGLAITGDGTYIYVANGNSESTFIKRYTSEGASTTWTINLTGNTKIYDMVAKGSLLYASDPNNDRILIYNLSDGSLVREFTVVRPGNIAVDNDDNVWVIQTSYSFAGNIPLPNPWIADAKILCYSNTGTKQPQEITDVVEPTDLVIDNFNRLLLTENGPDLQVRCYKDLNTTPILDDTFFDNGKFGQQGGIYTGNIGQIGDTRFYKLAGLGVDSANDIYINIGGPSPKGDNTLMETDLRKFNTSGELQWQLLGKEFVDMGDLDPADLSKFYTKDTKYSLDWSKTDPGTEWSYDSYIINPYKYSNDPRVKPSGSPGIPQPIENVFMRRIDGKLFMFGNSMAGDQGNVWIWRFKPSTDGDIAIPAACLGKYRPGDTYPPNVPESAEEYEFLWRDLNADGQCDANEYVKNPQNEYTYCTGNWPDKDGNIWRSYRERGIRKLVCTGVDSNGVPEYSFTPREYYSMPAPFTDLHYVRYFPETDVMYLAGWTTLNGATSDHPGGIHNIAKFSNWSTSPKMEWISDPADYDDLNEAESFDVAGNYIFTVYKGKDGGGLPLNGTVWAYNTADGSKAATIEPGTEVGQTCGWVDIWNGGIRAYRRQNGEYLLFVEDDAHAKTIIYRWCDAGTCYENCTSTVDSVVLSDHTITINGADTVALSSSIYPDSVCYHDIIWSSADENVAKVLFDGRVIGKGVGSTYVKGTSVMDDVSDSCLVTVSDVAVTEVVIPSSLTLFEGQSGDLTATVLPGLALNKNVNWSSSDTLVGSIKVISPNTITVTAESAGTCEIIVTSENSDKKDTCLLTVEPPDISKPLIRINFNEDTGSIANNSGTVGGFLNISSSVPTWSTNVPGEVGGASSVDFGTSTGNYAVESPAPIDELKGLSSFTVTGWLNCRDNTEGGGGNRVVSWINGGGDGVDIVYKGDGRLQVGINMWPDGSPAFSNAGKITTDPDASANNWRFFAVTYKSITSSLKFYFGSSSADAVLDTTITYDAGYVGNEIAKLAIGHFNDVVRQNATDRMFRGLIDQITIFDVALNEEEIVSVQNGVGQGVSVDSVSLDTTSLNLLVYDTYNLVATISPDTATNKNVTWSSDNESVAAVNQNGLVNATSPGSAIISVSTQDGNRKATCTVTVQKDTVIIEPLIKLNFNENTGNVANNTGTVGGYFNLSSSVPTWSANVPSGVGGASSVDFGTSTGNYAVESPAPIDELKGLSAFTVTGWLNCMDNSEGPGGNRIISWNTPGGDGVDIVFHSNGTLNMGINQWADEGPAYSSANAIPTDADAGADNWRFFAITYNSASGIAKFYIGTNAEDAVLDTTINYDRGNTGTDIQKLAIGHFNDAVRPDATDRMFRGIIDQVEIFNVALNEKKIIDIQRGVGQDVSVESVSLDSTSLSLMVDETYNLVVTIIPDTATNKNVTWSSDNESVATVNQNGLVTAISAGSAIISVATEDGNKIASCTVTVKEATGVNTISSANFNIYPNPLTGESLFIKGIKGNVQVKITDIRGKLLYHEQRMSDGEFTINGLKLSKGIYFISLQNNATTGVKKLIVK